MTRKDFELIASAIRASNPDMCDPKVAAIVNNISQALGTANAQFRVEQFLTAATK